MAEREIGKIYTTYEVKGLNKVEKQIQDVDKKTTGLTSNLKNLAGAIGLAFGIQQLISFGKEVSNLAGLAEGVQRAFLKLNRPDLLDQLEKATRGTVAELDLMKRAVQANNFKIPLDQLATYFQFATNRAIETGESVDYLVESIITGIGRKSVLVMDNLGISAVELQQEVAKVGDFGKAAGNIIAREMAVAGAVIDTTNIKTQRWLKTWQDAKVIIGDFVNNTLGLLIDFFGYDFDQSGKEFINRINEAAKALNIKQSDYKNWFEFSEAVKRASRESKLFSESIKQASKNAQKEASNLGLIEVQKLLDQTNNKIKIFKKAGFTDKQSINDLDQLTAKANAYKDRITQITAQSNFTNKTQGELKTRLEEIGATLDTLNPKSAEYIKLKKEEQAIINILDPQKETGAKKELIDRIYEQAQLVNKLSKELKKEDPILQAQIEIYGSLTAELAKYNAELAKTERFKSALMTPLDIKGKPTDVKPTTPAELTGATQAIKPAVDLTAEMSDLIGADLRESLSSLGDTLASTFARAIVGAESFNQALKGILASLAEIAIKSVFGTLIGSIGGGGLLGGLFSSVSTGNNGGIATGGTIGTQLKGINNSIQAMNMNMLQANGNAKPIILNVDGKTIATTLANVDNKLNRNGVNLNAY